MLTAEQRDALKVKIHAINAGHAKLRQQSVLAATTRTVDHSTVSATRQKCQAAVADLFEWIDSEL